jgi:hypothetical protein
MTSLVSRATSVNGAKANATSTDSRISANGRFVAFASSATNLDPDDTSSSFDVYVRDLQSATTTLVSRATGVAGASANSDAHAAAISADGRYVLFWSWASNLSPDDTDGNPDAYVRDLQTATTRLVSRAAGANGAKANNGAVAYDMSPDGRFVTMESNATNLSPDDPDTTRDSYVRDLQAETITLVNRATGPSGVKDNCGVNGGDSISADGRVAVFDTCGNLSPSDTGFDFDTYARDLVANTTTLVTRADGATGVQGNGAASVQSGHGSALTDDGNLVAFGFQGNNFSPDDPDTTTDAYLRDLQANTTVLAGRASGATGAKGRTSLAPVLSGDGRFLAFVGAGMTLPDGDDTTGQIFVRDLQTLTTSLESRATPGYERYVRPKGATPMRAALVPAFAACTSGNRMHGPPLAFSSCNPPTAASQSVTIGTPDANGAAARSTGYLTLTAVTGSPSIPNDTDVLINGAISDIRCKAGTATCGPANAADGADYSGELQASAKVRLTDRVNGPSASEEGTVADFPLQATLQCTPTVDTAVGADCAVSTTANALVPGFTTDGARGVYGMDQVQVFDGGPDGDVDTSGNTLFAVQGIFVP